MSEIFIVEVKRTPRGTARVKERVAAGKCVMCDTTTEQANVAGKTKQVCEKCRSRLRALMAKLPPRKQKQLEAELIRAGRYLEPHEIRSLKREDFLQKAFEHVTS